MEVIEANSTTTLYERLRASKTVQTLLTPCNQAWFVAVPFALALISNMLSWEIPVYILVVLTVCFIILFNHDTKPALPFFIAMYFGTSRPNSLILTDDGIYQSAWGLGLIIGLVCIAVICFAARLILLGEYRNFRLRDMKLSTGLIAFGLALAFGGIFSSEASWANFGYGCVQLVAFAFIYLYFIVTIDWKKCDANYLAYIMLAMGVLMCFQLLWIYISVDVVDGNGIIDKTLILTGWGIQNNIGGMMTLSLPFCFYLSTKGRYGWIYMIVAIAIFVASLFTLSRTSIIVGGIVTAIGGVLACVLSEKKLPRIITAVSAIAIAVLGIIIFWEALSELLITMLNVGLDLNGREELFEFGFRNFINNPVFGAGYRISNPELVPYVMAIPGRYHNMFIQIAASCGVVGILAYLFHFQQVVRMAAIKMTVDKLFISFGIITLMGLSQMDNHFFNIGPGMIYSAMLLVLEGSSKVSNELPRVSPPPRRN